MGHLIGYMMNPIKKIYYKIIYKDVSFYDGCFGEGIFYNKRK